MSLTAKQLKARKSGTGGSDSGTLMNLNKYKTPFQLWGEKTGKLIDEFEGNEATRMGEILEPVVRDLFHEKHEGFLRIETPATTFKHKDYKTNQMIGHVDGIIVYEDGDRGVLEIKTSRYGMGFDDSMVPASYEIQIRHYMAVLDLDWGYLAVLIGGQEYREYHFERNYAIEDAIVQANVEFWEAVNAGTPFTQPSTIKDFSAIYETITPTAAEADGELKAMLEAFRMVRSDGKVLMEKESEIKAKILKKMKGVAKVTEDGKTSASYYEVSKKPSFDAKAYLAKNPVTDQEFWKKGSTYRVLRIS